jgi:hypothetical protein
MLARTDEGCHLSGELARMWAKFTLHVFRPPNKKRRQTGHRIEAPVGPPTQSSISTTARREIEIAVAVDDEFTGPMDVLEVMDAQAIRVLVHHVYRTRNGAVVLLVADQPERAKVALDSAGYRWKINPVVMVRAADRSGAAARLGVRLFEAGVDILYSYTSSADGNKVCAVFKTTDDNRALRALEEGAMAHAA